MVAQPFARNERYGCGIPPAQPFATKERYGCGVPLAGIAGAILCRQYQVRTNLWLEIATTSVRTGFAMTSGIPCSFVRSAASRNGEDMSPPYIRSPYLAG